MRGLVRWSWFGSFSTRWRMLLFTVHSFHFHCQKSHLWTEHLRSAPRSGTRIGAPLRILYSLFDYSCMYSSALVALRVRSGNKWIALRSAAPNALPMKRKYVKLRDNFSMIHKNIKNSHIFMISAIVSRNTFLWLISEFEVSNQISFSKCHSKESQIIAVNISMIGT